MSDLTDKEQKYFDENQEAICDYCEAIIIEGPACSIHFMCEGRFCNEAFEGYKGDVEEPKIASTITNTNPVSLVEAGAIIKYILKQ